MKKLVLNKKKITSKEIDFINSIKSIKSIMFKSDCIVIVF